MLLGQAQRGFFDLGLLVEKGTREVCRKTLAWFFPCFPHSRLLHALINNELQHNCLIPIICPLNSGKLLELALCKLLVSKGVIYNAVAYGSKVLNSWIADSTLRVFFMFLLAEKILVKASQVWEPWSSISCNGKNKQLSPSAAGLGISRKWKCLIALSSQWAVPHVSELYGIVQFHCA